MEYDFTLCTKYSLYLYTQNKKLSNQTTHIWTPNFRRKKKKKITFRGFGILMVIEDQYNEGDDPSDFSFSLFEMFCQSQIFLFW